jgi:hypothetical protein
MQTLTLLKKIAAILLALCFVLPLSKCTAPVKQDAQMVDKVRYRIGMDMAAEHIHEVASGNIDGVGALLLDFTVFFLPIACLALKERVQSLVIVLGACASGYVLYFWVFLGSPQFGGLLALACWSFLFLQSGVTIVRRWRHGMLLSAESLAARLQRPAPVS